MEQPKLDRQVAPYPVREARRRRAPFGLVLVLALAFGACSDGTAPLIPEPTPAPSEPVRQGSAKPPSGTAGAAFSLATDDLAGSLTAEDLAQTIVGAGITISNVSFTGADVAAGTFSGGVIGFDEGIILSSGNVASVVGPNILFDVTTPHGLPGDPDLDDLIADELGTLDAAVLEFDFVPDADRVSFDYVFASDEYNEFVNTQFNDVFAFFVNGENCAVVGDPAVPVSINTVNNGFPVGTEPRSNPDLYINNDPFNGGIAEEDLLDTEMDGLTIVLTCEADVDPGVTNTMKLAIADVSDPDYDSNVFIRAQSLATPQPPTATITSPADGATFTEGDEIDFAGSGNDPEDGNLTGSALVWTSNLDGQIGTGASFSASDLSVGTHTITLTATDSDGMTGSTSVTIAVEEEEEPENQAPTAEIDSPADGATFTEGDEVSFAGAGMDPEDGDLTGAALVWTSSLDDQIGTGTSFSVSDLSVGEHTITLTATDSEGLSGTASVSITIEEEAPPPPENEPPAASITSPADGAVFTEGDEIDFVGTGMDPEDGELAGSALVWSVPGLGTIGTGTSFSRSDLPVGTHIVTLSVTDGEGLSGTASVSITIEEEEAPPPAEDLEIEIDIRPEMDPNEIDPSNTGGIAVALFGTADFDVRQVDLASIRLGDAEGDDVGIPPQEDDRYIVVYRDVDGDGITDLLVGFCIPDLVESGDLTGATTELLLRGELEDGRGFRGSGAVVVRSPGE